MDQNTWLEILSDRIYASLPSNYAKEWHLKFSESVNISSDLNKIKMQFLIFIVESVIDKFDHDKFPDVKTSISNILKLFKENANDKKSADADAYAAAAASADYAAADAADYAAAEAAYAAAAAASAVAVAADASADSSAYAAAYAASVASADSRAAARAAASAADKDYARSAYIAEKEKYYKKLADKLLELIEEYK